MKNRSMIAQFFRACYYAARGNTGTFFWRVKYAANWYVWLWYNRRWTRAAVQNYNRDNPKMKLAKDQQMMTRDAYGYYYHDKEYVVK